MRELPVCGLWRALVIGAAVVSSVCMAQGTASPSKRSASSAMQSMKDGAAVVDHVVLVGEVNAVDKASRKITLKNSAGDMSELTAGPEVRNFNQIKVGDRVRLDSVTSVALSLRKGGDGIREKVESESADVAKEGAKPGAAAMKRTTIVANVISVDRKKSVARLLGPSGRTLDVRIQDPAVLNELAVGDQVVASVTDAIAVNVRPAPAGK